MTSQSVEQAVQQQSVNTQGTESHEASVQQDSSPKSPNDKKKVDR